MPGPLEDLKVIELSQMMAGPTCGMLLADMGADVIKVELIPPASDDTRTCSEPSVSGESAAFMMMNRNKRSIALDLRTDGGKQVMRRLAQSSDVLMENYRKGAMEELGLGYDMLKRLNPKLIYCAITGYGRTGPYANKDGLDLIAQGLSGLMSITGEPGRAPVKVGSAVTEINAGILAALGVVCAYVHRLKTGQGQMVDTSLMEAGVQQTYWHAAIFFATGVSPTPTGSAHILAAPCQTFPTKDGWINIGGANQASWERLTKLVRMPALGEDPRFRSNADRIKNLQELIAILSECFRKRTTQEWLEDFDAADIPAGPINTVGDMLADPQVIARDMVVELNHPRAGRTKALGLPIKFSATKEIIRRPAPLFGEHTREILVELGYDDGDIAALVKASVVAVA